MTNRTVVILTDPARCQLADADTLVQAVFHAQQLNKAGLGASQAFCDHPAATMQFIAAYAKAYPELQLRSSDLPPPEQLYSIVADGRVAPLPLPGALDGAKLGEAGQLYPLYVLSLGAPDALMRALEHNRFAKSEIQLVEIPQPDNPVRPMSVAEAVAHEPISRASWQDEASAEPNCDADEALPGEGLGANDALKLSTVEVDLDHIQVDRVAEKDRADRVNAEVGPAAVVAPPAAAPAAVSGDSLNSSASGTSGGITAGFDAVAKSGPEAAPASVALSAPVLEPGATPPTAPTLLTPSTASPPTAPTPLADPTTALDEAESGPEADPVSGAPEDPGRSEADGTPVTSDGTPRANREAESPDEGSGDAGGPEDCRAADATDGDASETEAAPDQAHIAATSFSVPGEDVHYPPACSFAMDDDVAYPAPAESGPEFGAFEDFFGGAEEFDAVDFEAVLAELSDSAVVFAAPAPDLDLRLLPSHDAIPEPEEVGPVEAATSGPDEEGAEHQKAPAVHDLDL
jgi:hypothetical protein